MDAAFTMEGPLSKWTNVVNGWQYRWFVLDFNMGILFYYTSKEKMMKGDRRGCVKLKNAQVGIDDEDDSTFTITVDHKTFHFQARDSNERQKWLDALQEARDLHTHNYALLHHTNRLLDQSSSLSEFDRRIVEADAYLQILIEQQQELSAHSADAEEFLPATMGAISRNMQTLIELVKKTIVCLQFARESVQSGYSTISWNRWVHSTSFDVSPSNLETSHLGKCLNQGGHTLRQNPCSIQLGNPAFLSGRSGEGDGGSQPTMSADPLRSDSSPVSRSPSMEPKLSSMTGRRAGRADELKRAHSEATVPHLTGAQCPLPRNHADSLASWQSTSTPFHPATDIVISSTIQTDSPISGAANLSMPLFSYSSSEAGSVDSDENNEDEFFDTHEIVPDSGVPSPTFSNANPHGAFRSSAQMSVNNQQDFSTEDDLFDDLYDDEDEEDLGSVQSQGSIIAHLLSQLRIGMDLTRITLPTFILERRSTLEMYADFLAHADLWAAIPDAPSPRDRMVACLRWYLSAFHAGRRSSLAKKPYNPILGEIFRCYWALPMPPVSDSSADENLLKSGPVPWAPRNSVVFLAEQVSHHPPISAFYAEHVNKRISLAGHLWTKSKFLGLSIAVEMVGSAVNSLLNLDEEYVVTFPCGFGRNILTVPWIELGGKTSIICAKTGFVANVDFKTKPFYNGKKDLIRAEVLGPNDKKPFMVVEGEWNDKMYAKWSDGTSAIFIDTRATPVLKKHVLPRSRQTENESRKLWEQVTRDLKYGDIDAATDAKCRLEQRQRELARHRQENKIAWLPEYFRGEGGNWIYRSPLVQRLSTLPAFVSSIDESISTPVGTSSDQFATDVTATPNSRAQSCSNQDAIDSVSIRSNLQNETVT